ncbi:MAG: phage minor capsid protein [Ruminococcus sp.]|nr:phage minor capsid protein [Ruminococcus sp.]
MLNYRDIASIFEDIEISLVSSLKRNISRHRREENQYGFDWTAWQAEKLRNIDRFRRENAQIMNNYTNVIDSTTRQLMTAEFQQGVNGIVSPITDEPHFFGVDQTKVNRLTDDIVNLEKHAETAVLRTMDDVYRQTVNKVQLAMGTGSMTLQQAIDMSVKDFLNKGINCIVYRDGRRVNIADYVRMALRTTATRANLQGMSAKIRQLGYDTILVSSYGMCSETCLPWQGRPYIDDVFSMWDGEIQERTNGELWGKSHYCHKWFPLLSTAINSGLFHPNCRHTMTMWRDGDPIPEPQDNSEIQRRYRLEQHQRHLENKVRRAKRFVEGQSDPDNLKEARKRLREAQKELREFIAETNQNEGETVFKRDYGKEKIYTASVSSPLAQDNSIKQTEQNRDYFNEQNYDKISYSDSYSNSDFASKIKNSLTGKKYLNIVNEFAESLPNIENRKVASILENAYKNVNFDKSLRKNSYFNSDENKIYIAQNATPSTVAHELFHKADHYNHIVESGLLDSCINTDYENLKNKAEKTGLSIEDMLYLNYPEAFERKGRMKIEYRGFSDIINGMTDGDVKLGYGHGKGGYWDDSLNLKRETFAQYGRFYYDNNPDVLKLVNEVLPDTSKQMDMIVNLISRFGG